MEQQAVLLGGCADTLISKGFAAVSLANLVTASNFVPRPYASGNEQPDA